MYKAIESQFQLNRVMVMRNRRKGIKDRNDYEETIKARNTDIEFMTKTITLLQEKLARSEAQLVRYAEELRESNERLEAALGRLDRAGLVGRDL